MVGEDSSPPGGTHADPDAEVDREQRHLDRSHRALAAMRTRAERLLFDVRAAGKPDLDYEVALKRRVTVLGESRRPLLFGRIDELNGANWHIGRRHVEESDGDVLVADWRAPIATPLTCSSLSVTSTIRRRAA